MPWTPAHNPASSMPWQSRPGSGIDRTFPSYIPKLQCRDDKAPTAESQAAARLPFGIKMDEMKVNFSASKQSVVGENISTLLDSSYLLFIPSLAGGFAVSCSLWGLQGAARGAALLGHEARHVSGWGASSSPSTCACASHHSAALCDEERRQILTNRGDSSLNSPCAWSEPPWPSHSACAGGDGARLHQRGPDQGGQGRAVQIFHRIMESHCC